MKPELKEKIKNSGNNLHLSVVDILEKEGWLVDISPYYCDDLTDRPREIDIIATNRRQLYGASNNSRYFFNVVLCIECKYFTEDICFRVFDNNIDIGKRVLLNQKHDLNMKRALECAPRVFNDHHYLSQPKIAKLYEYWKKDQGNRSQEDDVFQAITQSVKSTIFFKKSKNSDALGSIYYPMVIYDKIDGIYFLQGNCTDNSMLDGLEKQKNAIFHLKYSYPDYQSGNTPQYLTKDFYVDFIHKEELKSFLTDIVEKECKKILEPILHDVHIVKQ